MAVTKKQAVVRAKSKRSKDELQTLVEHKVQNEKLAAVYEEINPRKAERLLECAPWVAFAKQPDGSKKLRSYFCRVRLCPVCTWRRSRKVTAQMHKIIAAIKADKPSMRYILLSMTQKNCEPLELDHEITMILRAFNNMTKLKRFQGSIEGYYRSLEVTHNLTRDDYHPHLHVLLAVDKKYFVDKRYIHQREWTDMWQHCLKVDYSPVVHIENVKGTTAAAIAEVAKYTVKSKDYLVDSDWELTVETVGILDQALHKRRLVAYGGVFKEHHKKLNLDDPNDGELSDEIQPEEKITEYRVWYSGFRQYVEQTLT